MEKHAKIEYSKVFQFQVYSKNSSFLMKNKCLQMLELFGAGTAALVSPISHIHYVNQDIYLPTLDQPQPIHREFQKHLVEIQYGYVEHPWAYPVE